MMPKERGADLSQQALYRSWRPQTFTDVVAQKQVVYPLQQAIMSGEIGHAYLFSGTRGTGKTSLAKIFAKAVNCLHPENGNPCNTCEICQAINDGTLLDVVEMDAASHNSVDHIRQLTDEVRFMPSRAKYKVYIIDEVHMLSTGAFNALLKTLEEPPEHVIFILATTEPERIPATILSRCQRFEFRRIPLEDIEQRLATIAEKQDVSITPDALYTIARLGDGALRDAISLFDQCQAGLQGEITKEQVLSIAGVVKDDLLANLAAALFQGDIAQILTLLRELETSGRNLQRFLQDFLRYLRDLVVTRITQHPEKLVEQPDDDMEQLKQLVELSHDWDLVGLISRLSQLNNDLRYAPDPKISLELALIKEAAAAPLRTDRSVTAPADSQATAPSQEDDSTDPAPMTAETKTARAKTEVQTPSAPPAEPPVKSQDAPAPADDTADPAPLTTESKTARAKTEPQTPSAPPAEPPVKGQAAPPTPADGATAKSKAAGGEQWEQVLNQLRDANRYDLVMLLRPAQVILRGDTFHLIYDKAHLAHGQTIQRPDSQEALQAALRASGSGQMKLTCELTEASDVKGEDVGEAEPVWVQKLRQGSQALGLEFTLDRQEDQPADGYLSPRDELPF